MNELGIAMVRVFSDIEKKSWEPTENVSYAITLTWRDGGRAYHWTMETSELSQDRPHGIDLTIAKRIVSSLPKKNWTVVIRRNVKKSERLV